MSKTLTGKVALVTGGSRGIGEAIALRLSQEGADVAISYASSDARAEAVVKKLKANGVRAAAFRADQADASQVRSLVKRTHEEFGKLDILVNNAGVLTLGNVGDAGADLESFDRQFAINVAAVATAVRTAAPLLSDNGRIISIGSGLGNRSTFPGMSDYSASKAAVAAYGRGWAHDLAPRGITVNSILPGPIDTEMNPEKGDFGAAQLAAIPLGRFGRPEEIAGAVAFLAGPDAGFITGISLDVDGGFAA
jgi:3-oxoacyl-[acyl-carrier protein] reductase